MGPDDGQRYAGIKQEEPMIDWLHDCYFAAVAGDSPTFEAWPTNQGEKSTYPDVVQKEIDGQRWQITIFMSTYLLCGVCPSARWSTSRDWRRRARRRKGGLSSLPARLLMFLVCKLVFTHWVDYANLVCFFSNRRSRVACQRHCNLLSKFLRYNAYFRGVRFVRH